MRNVRWSRRSQVGLEFDERYQAGLEHNYETPIYDRDVRLLSEVEGSQLKPYGEDKIVVVEEHARSTRQSSWLCLSIGAVVAAITIGAVVGGSLGVALSQCHSTLTQPNQNFTVPAANTTSLPQPTSSTTVAGAILNYVAPSTIYNVSVDCPNLNNQQITARRGDKFQVFCDTDITYDRPALESNATTGILNVADIIGTITYSFDDCVTSCGEYNFRQNLHGLRERCRSLTWNRNIDNDVAVNGANCWLKNGTLKLGQMDVSPSRGVSAQIVSYGT